LYAVFPHLKEKLEAQLAKIPTDRREWFIRNQTTIFSKLQQQHRLQAATATPHAVTRYFTTDSFCTLLLHVAT